jgi:hypothetical protein
MVAFLINQTTLWTREPVDGSFLDADGVPIVGS